MFKKEELQGVQVVGLQASTFNDAKWDPKPMVGGRTKRERQRVAQAKADPLNHKMDHIESVKGMLMDSVGQSDELANTVNGAAKSALDKDGNHIIDTPLYIDVLRFDETGKLDYTPDNAGVLVDGMVYELFIDGTRQRLLRGIASLDARSWREEWEAINPDNAAHVSTDQVMTYYHKTQQEKETLLREMFGSDLETIRIQMVDLKDWTEILLELFERTRVPLEGVVHFQQFMVTQAQALEQLNLKGKVALPSLLFPFHAIEPQNSKMAIGDEEEIVKEVKQVTIETPPSTAKGKKGKKSKKGKKKK